MEKVYSAPKEIQPPYFDFKDLAQSRKNEEDYVTQVKEWAKKNSKDKQYAGEELRIPHADGYACYIVFSSKPVKLIHLEVGDCWDAPLANRMLTKDVIEYVQRQKSLAQLFKKK